MQSTLAVKTFLGLTALAIFHAPALAVTRWIPLPVPKALVMDELQPRPNVSKGAVVYKNCRACHDIGPNAETRVGPDLTGIIGRPAAGLDDYDYSEALHTAGEEGLVWLPGLLDQYLAAPTKFLPGNKMAYVGLQDAQARRDLIAYLATFEIAEPTPIGGEETPTVPDETTNPPPDGQP